MARYESSSSVRVNLVVNEMVVVALILARSENSARLKCHRQTHTTNFLHFTCRAKPCVSLQSAPQLAL